MGQKVSPIGMRVGVIRDWESRWYAEKDYGTYLLEDNKIREFLNKELRDAYVSRVEIERSKNRVEIIIRAARPGVIVGTNGDNVTALKKKLEKLCGGKNVNIRAVEVANPDLDAHLVALAPTHTERTSGKPKRSVCMSIYRKDACMDILRLLEGFCLAHQELEKLAHQSITIGSEDFRMESDGADKLQSFQVHCRWPNLQSSIHEPTSLWPDDGKY